MKIFKEKGQSLVEVMVAIAVAIIVILALVLATTSSIRNALFARNQTLATQYAQETIENIRALRDKSTWQDFINGCEDQCSSGSGFSCSTDCEASGEIVNVTVTVSWSDAKGTHKSELETRLTKWK